MPTHLTRNCDSATHAWSHRLIEQTRSALLSPPVTLDGHISMKNINGRFGKMHISDLIMESWKITDRNNGETCLYESSDELIAAGWAID